VRDDDEDALPFASRPKVVRPKTVQKPKQVPVGVTTSYNEVVDGDSEDDDYGDIDNTMPTTKLAGASLHSALAEILCFCWELQSCQFLPPWLAATCVKGVPRQHAL